ncbi:hypothetical protein LC593_10430 [Nostoc sp. CHAB 5844]|nr:hypothetical protein [Nostoc sp. CHAB 5844]
MSITGNIVDRVR